MKIPRKLVGELIEIRLSKGFAYGLCTHDLKTQGQVILLYRNLTTAPLEDPVSSLTDPPHRMAIKLPLRYVLKDSAVRLVGKKVLSRSEKTLPKFRSLGLFGPREKPKGWWIIDGETETWVEGLTQEMAHYSDDGLYNLEAIEDLFERDLYPHSRELLCRGPLAFELSPMQ